MNRLNLQTENTLRRTGELIELIYSNWLPVARQKIDAFHDEQLPKIKEVGKIDGAQGIPMISQTQPSEAEQQIPLTYEQQEQAQSSQVQGILDSLELVKQNTIKALKRDSLYQEEVEIDDINAEMAHEEKKEGRKTTDAQNELLEYPFIPIVILLVFGVVEMYMNTEAFQFMGLDEKPAQAVAMIFTTSLLFFAKLIGGIIKRKPQTQQIIQLAIWMGLAYLVGAFFLSYCRADFLLFKAAADPNNNTSETTSNGGWDILGHFEFILAFVCHLLLGFFSLMLGYLSSDSSKSFETSYLRSLTVKEKEKRIEQVKEKIHRVQERTTFDALKDNLDKAEMQIQKLKSITQLLQKHVESKIQLAILAYREENIKARKDIGPAPFCFGLNYPY